MRRISLKRLASLVFGAAGIGFMATAFWSTAGSVRGGLLPAAGYVAASVALGTIGVVAGAAGWITLFDSDSRASLFKNFVFTQLGKYIPGGIWQPVGQIGYAARTGVSLRDATSAFPIHAIAQAAAGATVGALTVLGRPLPPWMTAVSLGPLVLLLGLNRSWTGGLLGFAARILRRDGLPVAIPSHRAILTAFGWGIVSISAAGLGFALLAGSIAISISVPETMTAWALAWTIGFIAVPFPAGLGVREVILIAGIPGVLGAEVIAASVYHRLVTIAAEAILIIVTRAIPNRHEPGP
jgi:hypothetical protein